MSASDPLLGHTLDGRYQIVDVAGRGGIGVVYRARQAAAGGRDVAVKVLTTVAAQHGSSAPRFENEAKIIGSLKHPNTIKLFDTGRTTDGRLYIVTEFLEGETLMDRIERGELSQLETATILGAVARSLEEAHERGIVHRDLKPANIFLERVGGQEVVKVLDFGIAKLVQNERLTAPLQIFGTPGYMSPEQCRGEDVDGRADLFSLGIVAFVCLTGRLPYDNVSADGLLLETMEGPAPTLKSRTDRELEPVFEDLVTTLLAFDPSVRFPTAGATADAFENVVKVLDSTVGVVLPESTPSASSSARHVPSLPPAAALRDPSKAFDDGTVESTNSDVRDTVTVTSPFPDADLGAADTAIETELATRTREQIDGDDTAKNVLLAVGAAVLAAVIVVVVLLVVG